MYIGIFGLSFISGVIAFLLPYIKSKKGKQNAENTIKALTSMEMLCNNIQAFVIKAEKFKNYSGQEKKEWVMTQLKTIAFQKNIEFAEDVISEKVEEVVKTTNEVNIDKVSRETKNVDLTTPN